ncbi:hypothetical protein JMA_22520 [Jeotgalibacillus malaysiensis]|uniref:Uncharacterized protein n=1 Tax=Jeotgalibacillus malaysiensis TaxID=1508404 RepID=A0A0B5AU73_9BACL|nr:hypothetical protein [Jeotgalibacillus malaysiensis]AJD91569.1 hypothetical protein JMA_22520 [Jeotgalibacillus malaysiensis]
MPLHVLNEKEHAEALANRAYLKREDAAAAFALGESIEYMHKGEWTEINPFFHTTAVFQFAPAFRRKQNK